MRSGSSGKRGKESRIITRSVDSAVNIASGFPFSFPVSPPSLSLSLSRLCHVLGGDQGGAFDLEVSLTRSWVVAADLKLNLLPLWLRFTCSDHSSA